MAANSGISPVSVSAGQLPPLPPPDFLPPAAASPEVLHRHFLREANLANRSAYRLLVLIRHMEACAGFEQFGCVTIAQYLSLVCGITGVSARERVRVAFALAELPEIESAFARGKLSYSKVRAVTRVATAATEAVWLKAAMNRTAEELEVMVARSQKGKPMERRLLTRALNQHTTRMVVDLPVEEMELVAQALESVRRAAGGKLSASEALVYLAADSLSGEPKPIATAERYTVIVHADKEGTAWVETESGPAPLRPAVVARLLCDCTLRLAREEADGSFVLSRRGRTVPVVTRRAIEVRDRRRCRVPGCNRRLWLEAHHLKLWSRGGKHRRSNLLLMCRQHHQLCHEGLLIVDLDEEGEFRFTAVGGWKLGEGEELEENWEPVVWESGASEDAKEDDGAEGDAEAAPTHDPEEWSLPSLPVGGRGRRRRWGPLLNEPRTVYRVASNVSAETFRARQPLNAPPDYGSPAFLT